MTAVRGIRIRPPDCYRLSVQSENSIKNSERETERESEHVLLTRTHLKALQAPKSCHSPPGYHAAASPDPRARVWQVMLSPEGLAGDHKRL